MRFQVRAAMTIIIGLISGSTWGQTLPPTQQTLTLRDAILLALRYNPSIQNAEIERVVDKFNLRVVENNYELQYALTGNSTQAFTRTSGQSSNSYTNSLTPQITKNGYYGTQYSVQMNNPTTQGVYNPGIDLSIVQPLLRGSGKDVATAPLYNAQEQEKIAQLTLRSTLISTVVQVIEAYRTLVSDQNNVEINKLSLADYAETIKLDNALIKAGRLAPTEVVQAQADYAQAEVNLETAENAVETDKLNLLNLLGLPTDTPIKVPNDIELCPSDLGTLDDLYKLAMVNNISYLTSAIQVKIDERNLLVAKDNARTQLNFQLDGNTGNGSGTGGNAGLRSLTNNKNTNVSMQLNLSVPIDNYPLQSAIVDAQVQLQQDRITLANTARQMQITVKNDWINVLSNYKQIQLAKTTLELNQKNQDFLNAKLKYGLVSTFEVTTKQQDLDAARVQYIQTKINYLNSLTQLYSDMGTELDEWKIKVRY